MYLTEERLTRGTYHKEDETTLRVLSLGAGVQSSTILLMMMNGEIKPADVCIFADTGNEPKEVYEHLEKLKVMSTIPIHIVGDANIVDDVYDNVFNGFIKIPTYTRNEKGRIGISQRQCTLDYKIKPIHREIRRILGRQRLRYLSIEIVMGVSYDEMQRMAYPEKEWGIHCYPLVSNLLTREDCIKYYEDNGMPKPPRSSCIMCPYRSDREWLEMKEQKPQEFAEAVKFDYHIRDMQPIKNYISRHAVPLDKVDFTKGINQKQSLIDIECEGYCGH